MSRWVDGWVCRWTDGFQKQCSPSDISLSLSPIPERQRGLDVPSDLKESLKSYGPNVPDLSGPQSLHTWRHNQPTSSQIPKMSRCKDEYSSTGKTVSAAKSLSDDNVSFGKGAKGASVSPALPGLPGECAWAYPADRHSCSLTQSFHF